MNKIYRKSVLAEIALIALILGITIGIVAGSYICEYTESNPNSFITCEEADGDLYVFEDYLIRKEFFIVESGRSFDKEQCLITKKDK